MVELICASEIADRLRLAPAVTVESWMVACTSAGCSLSNASEISGEPSSASRVLNNRFCASHPMVLNASVTPTAVSPDVVILSTVASIRERFCASRITSPAVAVTVLLVIVALDLLRMVLVAMVPFTASTAPVPNALPPDAVTVLSTVAVIVEFSRASSRIAPLTAVTCALSIVAATSLRTSLRTTTPPIAVASESLIL